MSRLCPSRSRPLGNSPRLAGAPGSPTFSALTSPASSPGGCGAPFTSASSHGSRRSSGWRWTGHWTCFSQRTSCSSRLSLLRRFLTMKNKHNQTSKLQLDKIEPLMIHFGQDVCGNLDASLRREWLETNGIGGFASSTIIGMNPRRYHGLLVAATKPPVGRFVLLSKFEETLRIANNSYELSANRYPGVVHPQGFRYLKEFRLDPFPIFTYEVDGIEIEKTVFMRYGENTTVIHYTLNTPTKSDICLELRPLIAFRDYHSLTHENGSIDGRVNLQPNRISITPYQGLPTLHLAHTGSFVENSGVWYKNFEYDA